MSFPYFSDAEFALAKAQRDLQQEALNALQLSVEIIRDYADAMKWIEAAVEMAEGLK